MMLGIEPNTLYHWATTIAEEIHFKYKNVKWCTHTHHAITSQKKKAEMAALVLTRVELRAKNTSRDKALHNGKVS
jgi:hypothetical protein